MLSLRLAEGLTPVLAARYGQDYAALLRRAEPLQKAGARGRMRSVSR